jgi:segregation and condensation protein B
MTDDKDSRSNVILLRLPGLPSSPTSTENERKEVEERPGQPPPTHRLKAIIEALLIASGRPITVDEIVQCLSLSDRDRVHRTLREIQDDLRDEKRGFELVEVARGWQFRTSPICAPWVKRLIQNKPVKLSKAALEALSIVAYQQPLTRAEVEHLRGVDTGSVLRALVDQNLICISKHKIGSALVYETTDHFLSIFGLRDLADLPHLRDLRELEGMEGMEGDLTEKETTEQQGGDDDAEAEVDYEESDRFLQFRPANHSPNLHKAGTPTDFEELDVEGDSAPKRDEDPE